MSNVDGKDRPTARGHRFGPDLTCSECGLSWEDHQASPGPCEKVVTPEPAVVDPSPGAADAPPDSGDSTARDLARDSKEDDPFLD